LLLYQKNAFPDLFRDLLNLGIELGSVPMIMGNETVLA